MQIIKNKTYSEERALYGLCNAELENCRFEGEEDGESFLKESENISMRRCFMDLRYPLWHGKNLNLFECEMTEKCRAALWYDEGVTLERCKMNGIKALRECSEITLKNISANSPEFAWKCRKIQMFGGNLVSEYAFLGCETLALENLDFTGKYSFQYTKDLSLKNCRLKTKDAFWHSKNATATDCVIDGEYLGWYSDGLTLIRCHIKGTQPLCYCKNLTLIDCTMEDCDLSFEYSEVDAKIRGKILSVKNPREGRIEADDFGEIILKDSKYPTNAEIVKKGT